MRRPRSALLGCKALKCAHLSSRPRVPAEVAEQRARSGLVWVMLDRSAVEVVHDERAQVVRLEPKQLVGPAVEIEQQNAIDLVLAVLASSHTCEDTFGGFLRSQREVL